MVRRFLVVVVAACLAGCGVTDGQAQPASEAAARRPMSQHQAIEEMGAEIDRSCAAAIEQLADPVIRYDRAWAPYGTRDEVLVRVTQCVQGRWAAMGRVQRAQVADAQRKAAEERVRKAAEARKAAEQRRQAEALRRQVEEQRRRNAEAARLVANRRDARRSAQDYLKLQAFSRSGLIEQVGYEGFSTADATWGVDSLQVNWDEQASRSAQGHLNEQDFSRLELLEQLVYEGFSRAQAEHGVDASGL